MGFNKWIAKVIWNLKAKPSDSNISAAAVLSLAVVKPLTI